MKAIFFRTLALIICFQEGSFAQTLEGFWGIKFGDAKEVVRSKILSTKGYKAQNVPDFLIYNHVTFGHHTAKEILIKFFNDKVTAGVVKLDRYTNITQIDQLFEVRDELTEKYGPPSDTNYESKGPFNGQITPEVFARGVQGGYIKVAYLWDLKSSQGREMSIMLHISDELNVSIYYADRNSMNQIRNKEKNDY